MIGKGLIEVVNGRLRVSVTLDDGRRKYASFTRFVNKKHGVRWTPEQIRREFSDKQLQGLALECQAAILHDSRAQQQDERAVAGESEKQWGPHPEMAIGRWVVIMLRRRRDKGIKKSSLRLYHVAGRVLIKACGGWQTPLNSIPAGFGHELLSRLNNQDPVLRGVTHSLRPAQPWSSNTIKSTVKHVRSFFVGAVQSHLIKENPLDGVQVQAKKSRDNDFTITADYAAELIDACLNRPSPAQGRPVGRSSRTSWAAAIGMARFAGLRQSEVRHISPDRVDLDCRHHDVPTLVVRNDKTYDCGGNDREFRHIPIHAYLVGILRHRLAELPEGAQYVVGNGWQPMSKSTLGRSDWLFRQVGKPVMPALFQNCRRSYCRDLREQVPIDAYCEIVGHSIETAAKFYLKTEARHRRAIAENIGPALGPLKMTGS